MTSADLPSSIAPALFALQQLLRPTGRWLILALLAAGSHAADAADVDLAIQISGPGHRVSTSSNLIYRVAVTNHGDLRATNVRVTNELAIEMTFVSAGTTRGSCSQSGRLVICQLGNLNPGVGAGITIRTQPTVNGEVFATASVNADQPDLNPQDNTAVTGNLLGISDLALSINNPPEPVTPGQVVTYVLTVTNKGPDATTFSSPIALSDVGAWGNELVSYETTRGEAYSSADGSGGVSWVVFDMPPGSMATLTIRVRVLLSLGPETPFVIWSWVYTSPYSEADPVEDNFVSDSTAVSNGPGVIQFPSSLAGVLEDSMVPVEVERFGGDAGTVGVHYFTHGLTAVAGVDFIATNGILEFAPGEVRKTLHVRIPPTVGPQCVRTFEVRLDSPTSGAFLRSRTNCTIRIEKDLVDVVPRGVTECITVTHTNPLKTATGDYYGIYSISRNGRFALFASSAADLVPNDTNGMPDVFQRDLMTGVTRLVGVKLDGAASGNGASYDGVMSSDGRHVVFYSSSTDLVTNTVAEDQRLHVYLRDMQTETTTLISRRPDGAPGNAESYLAIVNSNGTVVAFMSNATDLDPACQCETTSPNIYAWHAPSGQVRLVTRTLSGTGLQDPLVVLRSLSADGRYVLFESASDQFVPGDTNTDWDLFRADLLTGTIELVSINHQGTGPGAGPSMSAVSPMSPDGRFVLFTSLAPDLTTETDQGNYDVYLRDMLNGVTRLVSVNWTGTNASNDGGYFPSMTPDGRLVAFVSRSTDLIDGNATQDDYINARGNVFLRDMQTGIITLVSTTCHGNRLSDGNCTEPVITADGGRLLFLTDASGLVPGIMPGYNIYMRDLEHGQTVLVSANSDFTGGGVGPNIAFPSDDGRIVIFSSSDANLSPVQDDNQGTDRFVWRELPPGTNAQLNMKVATDADGPVRVTSLMITNLGPDIARNVVITNAVTVGLRFVNVTTTSGSCTIEPDRIVCALGDLTRRGGATISLLATAVGDGLATQTAFASLETSDPLRVDNAAVMTSAFALPGTAALSIVRLHNVNYVNWLANPGEAELEWKPSLDASVHWQVDTSPRFNNGTIKTAPVSSGTGGSSGYYRLRR